MSEHYELQISGATLPVAWEQAMRRLWEERTNPYFRRPTEYDKLGDPLAISGPMKIVVTEPTEEPRIHRAMPCGIADLEVYRMEVVDGIHDLWQDNGDPQKWQYTYSNRMRHYGRKVYDGMHEDYRLNPGSLQVEKTTVDQVQYVIDTLAACWYSRRAQIVIWNPFTDTKYEHCPCLQRLWFTLVDTGEYEYEIKCHAYMRSNDCYKATLLNMYAFTSLQAEIAYELEEEMSCRVRVGMYTHTVDDMHIYGSYFDEVEAFIAGLHKRTFEERTYRTEDVQDIIKEAQDKHYAK